jgi:chromosome segregation ATPase
MIWTELSKLSLTEWVALLTVIFTIVGSILTVIIKLNGISKKQGAESSDLKNWKKDTDTNIANLSTELKEVTTKVDSLGKSVYNIKRDQESASKDSSELKTSILKLTSTLEKLNSQMGQFETNTEVLNERFQGLTVLLDEKMNNLKENATVKKVARTPLKRRT